MSDDGLYHVVMHRKGLLGQVQLNYSTKTTAKQAFEAVRASLTPTLDSSPSPRFGIVTPIHDVELTDDFGCTLHVDASDISHLALIDASKVYEMRVRDTLMQARANARANRQASVDPVIGGRVVTAANQMPS